MADDLQLKQEDAIRQNLSQTVDTTTQAVLAKIGAENVSTTQEERMLDGKPAVVRSAAFTYEKNPCGRASLDFQTGL